MNEPLRLAVVGVGRIGQFHAQHFQELAAERGDCELVAVADRHADTAARVATRLQAGQDAAIAAFDSTEALIAAGVADAVLVASRTEDHQRDSMALVEARLRVLLEKPLADTLDEARDFGAWLDEDETRARAVMLAFQRRYDPAMLRARQLLQDGVIGELFKIVSILEDPEPPPNGYQSAGLLTDMGVHNADEILWLSEAEPTAIAGFGARLHNQQIADVTAEDFDDVFVQMWLGECMTAQLQVSRNHVAGYRNECLLFGREGRIHVGHFDDDPLRVWLEVYGREHNVIEKRVYDLRDYECPVPVFIRRFGLAYKAEAADFIDRCTKNEPFAVTHQVGLRAMEIVTAGARALKTGDQVAPMSGA
ncbi:MAG: Gfo/Idh/MocA family oxidoreductase [Gemmatimonadetes bacterium]|nr:Gfo/Idh/MocA family oxidoreductase [Gemmatimonadota bacterium]MBT7863521.1 Gfo/Idh/MocA family oxidoreductase [Gemmatimonadota bacterium]